ncbi:hypothetical protein PUN28_001262 [Cardiocondyla obscurior]|uniref:Uncharacterized protein n=1 Tax=Cardiocondyla obscurior TaxID=286306 RepID=A0AAW2H4G2_9HYME
MICHTYATGGNRTTRDTDTNDDDDDDDDDDNDGDDDDDDEDDDDEDEDEDEDEDDKDDDDDEDEEENDEKDGTRLRGHATSTLCTRMRPARLLPDYSTTYQQKQQEQQKKLRQGQETVSRQTSIGAKFKDVYRFLLTLFRAKKAKPKSSTTTTEKVLRLDWRDLRVQRTASAEPTTTVQPSRQQRRRRNPGALAFPRRCGAVVRSTGVG